MITLEPISSHNVAIFREVRLRALKDSPSAFGSTYAREIQLTDAEWFERAARWNGDRGIGFLATDGSTVCGIAGSFLDEADPMRAQLISMWTAPEYRQRGVGRVLVEKIAAWASGRGARALTLMVTSSNESAMLFYRRLGFTPTGHTEPYPNDPSLVEYEMSRPLL
jgi:ribosomal protein S18 acetylase RimI-like enzyme